MLTKRDRRLLHFIDDFGCVNSEQAYQLFFSDVSKNICLRRLTQLVEQGHLSRERENVSSHYIYYSLKKPQQIDHHSRRVDFFVAANSYFKLREFKCEYEVGKVKSDAYMEFELYNKVYAAFVEIQLSNGNIQKKYEELYLSGRWREHWENFPIVIVATNRKLPFKPSKLKYIVLDVDAKYMDIPKIRTYLLNSVEQLRPQQAVFVAR